MKLLVILILILSSNSIFAKENPKRWIAIEKNVLEKISKVKIPLFQYKETLVNKNENYFLVDENEIDKLAKNLHHLLKRCGGFRVLKSKPNIINVNKSLIETSFSDFWPNDLDKYIQLDYSIKMEREVQSWFEKISSEHIDSIINHLTTYHTRYYKSVEGELALQWIGKTWEDLTAIRSDAKVEYYKHQNHNQPSIILTIEGSDPVLKNEIIIIGGHGDSINTDDEQAMLRAPGANDNAAGIAVISDIIKIMVEQNYRPKHTIQFIAYAAEEVGLQGSSDIAQNYRNLGKKVIGVLQLDGINYTGKTFDMALISDLTYGPQNIFMAQLIDQYLKANWSWDKCGYACSDHYSWHSNGYRASFPVEAIMSEQDPFIHTSQDTFDKSNNNSLHAQLFEKLSIAYLIELDN